MHWPQKNSSALIAYKNKKDPATKAGSFFIATLVRYLMPMLRLFGRCAIGQSQRCQEAQEEQS